MHSKVAITGDIHVDIFGTNLTPTALAFLRGIDQIAISADARTGSRGCHLIGYDVLQRYTGVTIAALHSASRQLRNAGLIEARRDLGPRPDSWVMCFELTVAGRDLLDKIAGSCGIIVDRAAVTQALQETMPWQKELRASQAQYEEARKHRGNRPFVLRNLEDPIELPDLGAVAMGVL